MKPYVVLLALMVVLVNVLCGCNTPGNKTLATTVTSADETGTQNLIKKYHDLPISWEKYELLDDIADIDDPVMRKFMCDVFTRPPKDPKRDYKFTTTGFRVADSDLTNWYRIELWFAAGYLAQVNTMANEDDVLRLISKYPCTMASVSEYLVRFRGSLSQKAKERIKRLDYSRYDMYFQGLLAYVKLRMFGADIERNVQILKRAFQMTEKDRVVRTSDDYWNYWETNYEMLLECITELVKETKNPVLLQAIVAMQPYVDGGPAESLSASLAVIGLEDLDFFLSNIKRDDDVLDLVGFGLGQAGMLGDFRKKYKDIIENPNHKFHKDVMTILK